MSEHRLRHTTLDEPFRSFHVYRMFFDDAEAQTEIHSHAHDHLFVVIAGRCRVETRDEGGDLVSAEHDADSPIAEVRAGTWHRITALEPGTRALCVFSRYSAHGHLPDPKIGGQIRAGTNTREVW